MRIKNLLLLVLLAGLWGPSFLFIKVAVTEIPPLTMVLARVFIAAVLLVAALRVQGQQMPGWGPVWKHLAFIALVHNTIPFVLFAWGEQYVDSALASIMNGTTPLFTIVLAHMFVMDDKMSLRKTVGALVGFGGLIVLVAPSVLGGVQASTWGLLALAVASAMYGVAIVYSRLHLRGLPAMVAPTGQMILATLYLLPLALLVDRPFSLPLPSLPALLSLLALAVFGTAVGFIVYYRLIETAAATYTSMVTYLIPVVGVILGVLVLGERLAWTSYAGCALILLGVMTANGLFKNIARWRIRARLAPQASPSD